MTGIGGQGIQLIAKVLAQAGMREGRQVMMFGVFMGTIRLRVAFTAECRLSASRTCGNSSTSCSMRRGIPTVETVMRRGLNPKPSVPVSRASAVDTES